jgi:hypothetical protein
MKAEITYFEKGGEDNTVEVLQIALQRFQKGDINAIVVASSFGKTAEMAAYIFAEAKIPLLIVGEVIDGKQSPSEDIQKALSKKGHRVI